ncbi:MAG: 30S ribosomal protein S16 [Planctomycetota bacterium]|nr:30S ribosomal protein S16 [Planctomycetota bacterium]
MMAVRIRMTRTGRKNSPSYRIAVFDSRTRRDGKYIEKLGQYNPGAVESGKKVTVNRDRLMYWIKVGAKPTLSLERLLKHTAHL